MSKINLDKTMETIHWLSRAALTTKKEYSALKKIWDGLFLMNTWLIGQEPSRPSRIIKNNLSWAIVIERQGVTKQKKGILPAQTVGCKATQNT